MKQFLLMTFLRADFIVWWWLLGYFSENSISYDSCFGKFKNRFFEFQDHRASNIFFDLCISVYNLKIFIFPSYLRQSSQVLLSFFYGFFFNLVSLHVLLVFKIWPSTFKASILYKKIFFFEVTVIKVDVLGASVGQPVL